MPTPLDIIGGISETFRTTAVIYRHSPAQVGPPPALTSYSDDDEPDDIEYSTEDVKVYVETHSRKHSQQPEGIIGENQKSVMVDVDLDVSGSRYGEPDRFLLNTPNLDTKFYRVVSVASVVHPMFPQYAYKRVLLEEEEPNPNE